jgi:hypothetical protein
MLRHTALHYQTRSCTCNGDEKAQRRSILYPCKLPQLYSTSLDRRLHDGLLLEMPRTDWESYIFLSVLGPVTP